MKAFYLDDTGKGPGYGFLYITEIQIAIPLEGIRFCIVRASDRCSLGKGGWQPSEVFLSPPDVTLTEEGFALPIGPDVVDGLDPNETYRMVLLSAGGISIIGSLEVPEVAYSVLRNPQGTGAIPEPEPYPELDPYPEPESDPEFWALPLPESDAPVDPSALEEAPDAESDLQPPAPENAAPAASRHVPTMAELPPLPRELPQRQAASGMSRPLLFGLLFLVLAAGGFAFWKYMENQPPVTTANNEGSDPAGTPPPAAVDSSSGPTQPSAAARPSSGAVELPVDTKSPAARADANRAKAEKPLSRARAHLSTSADPAESVRIAKGLLADEGGADAAFLLAEDAAEKGDAEAMLLTGRFYDPTDKSPSGSIIKDAQQAFFWYQQASRAGRQEAAPRLEALRAWAESEAAKGSAEAREILQRFRANPL